MIGCIYYMKIIADTHTHTLASTHAYSTILENAKFASEIGLKYLAITDHGPAVCDSPHIWHTVNLRIIPDELYGVKILRGVEANIMENGSLDIEDAVLAELDWVVASYHEPAFPPSTEEKHTQAYINVAMNPNVCVIGHSGLDNYRYDYEKAIKVFKEQNKLVEINNHSFVVRKAGIKNCIEIARLCKKYEVPVVVNSDAHFAYSIGQVDNALKLLEELDFPMKLIVNADEELFDQFINSRKAK